ncbi:hypothetical protein WA026_019753 [Henosepilachna vigintioctopunctata]|uniref:CHHC U11-48K-type domain-containing protein n=1 Tax=Henosepilachna vigintioctopunctata TaxID=420089 RepID=A0AAW1URV0_9CUCU
MNSFTDSEQKITCPYNQHHSILKSRMSKHLVKCRKTFGDVETVLCDFNTTHNIPKPELRYHHEICEDRRVIERKIIVVENVESFNYPVGNTAFVEEESWDNQVSSSYNPNDNSQLHNVIRHLDVESASKRKEFRLNERQRLNKLMDARTSKRNGNVPEESFWGEKSVEKENVEEQPSKEKVNVKSLSEEAAHLSLNDRIKKGNKKTYEPNAI